MNTGRMPSSSRRISRSSWPTTWHFFWILRPPRQQTSLILLLACFATTASATVTALSFPEAPDQGVDSNYPIFLQGIAATPISRVTPGLGTNPEVANLRILDTAAQPGSDRLADHSKETAPTTDHSVSPGSRTEFQRTARSDSSNTPLAGLTFTSGTINSAMSFTASQLQMLAAYIANGGENPFRADVHLSNDGIKFATSLTPIPEIEAIYPMITLLTAIVCTQLLRRRRSVHVQAIQILKG